MEICTACGSDNIKKCGQIEGYIQGDNYVIFSCLDCKTKCSSPHVSSERVYNLIYSHKDDVPGYARYSMYAKEVLKKKNPLRYLSLQEETYYGVIKSIHDNVRKGGKILEVGCGLGYMTYALSKAGYDATGLDISSEAVNRAKESYGDRFMCGNFFDLNLNNADQKYDAICMLELIEHVEDPDKYIKHARDLLGPRGVIIVTTPNKTWYPENTVWGSDLPPVHITWFSEEGMKALGDLTGCFTTYVSYTFYNIRHGSILKPSVPPNVNPPFFTKEGHPLFSVHTHSTLYEITNKMHVYSFLKGIKKFVRKLREFFTVMIFPQRASFTRSHTQCIVLRTYDPSK